MVRQALPLLVAASLWGAEVPKTRVDEIFAAYTNETPGCAVGVAERGTVVLRAAYGMADLERNVPIRPDSVFESGSVAKQFTAAALVLLEQQGKLSLNDPLRKHLPEIPDYGVPLTLRQVLSHVSGLREWRLLAQFSGFPEGTRVYENADLLAFAARQRELNFQPGTAYSYSNTGYNALPILVERVLGGKTFQAFTREAIFDPLEMSSTRWRDNFRAVYPRRVLAYAKSGERWEQRTAIANIIGAGGMLTTVDDLLRWNENFVHARVGGRALVEAMETTATLSSGKRLSYALGLVVSDAGGTREVSHSGATDGYRTWLGRYPQKQVSVAVLCNQADANPTELGRRVARLWTGAAPAAAAREGSAAVTDLARFDGLYRRVRDNTTARVEWKSGALHLAGSPAPQLRCEEASPIRCRTANDEAQVYERVEPFAPAEADLAAYSGVYASAETQAAVRVRSDGGVLRMQIAERAPVRLRPTFRDAFEMEGTAIRFERDATGRVTGFGAGDARVWNLRFRRTD